MVESWLYKNLSVQISAKLMEKMSYYQIQVDNDNTGQCQKIQICVCLAITVILQLGATL